MTEDDGAQGRLVANYERHFDEHGSALEAASLVGDDPDMLAASSQLLAIGSTKS